MKRRLKAITVAAGLSLLLLLSGCLGPSHATGRLYQFNAEFENKWAQEGMFLLLIPGYILFSAGDQLIFNSIYWWTGDNPIDPPKGKAEGKEIM